MTANMGLTAAADEGLIHPIAYLGLLAYPAFFTAGEPLPSEWRGGWVQS